MSSGAADHFSTPSLTRPSMAWPFLSWGMPPTKHMTWVLGGAGGGAAQVQRTEEGAPLNLSSVIDEWDVVHDEEPAHDADSEAVLHQVGQVGAATNES